MPELPEVESVRRGLATLLPKKPRVEEVVVHRGDLRVPVTPNLAKKLRGQHLVNVRRRAKYLLLDFTDDTLISHLGMSGSWRLEVHNAFNSRKHDHIIITLAPIGVIVFNDPRRFGLLEMHERGTEEKSPWLKNLGVEPLNSEFTAKLLAKKADGRKTGIKTFLMDQKNVVGVGNIYASEVLYMAGIRPTRKVSRLSNEDWKKITRAVRVVLKKSIQNGGTTLRDHALIDGADGSHQLKLKVYDKKDQPCPRCRRPIRQKTIVGRSTYWCAKCQV